MKHPGLLNRNEVTFHNNNTKLQNSQNIEKGIIDFEKYHPTCYIFRIL